MARSATLVLAAVALLAVAAVSDAQINTPAGTFDPNTNVVDQLGVSSTVSAIITQLEANDFSGAQSTYDTSSTLKVRLFGRQSGLPSPRGSSSPCQPPSARNLAARCLLITRQRRSIRRVTGVPATAPLCAMPCQL